MSSSPTSLKSAHSLRNLAHRWGIPPRFQMRLIGAPAAAAGNFDAIKNWPPTSQSVNQLLTCAGYATPPPPPPLIPVTKNAPERSLTLWSLRSTRTRLQLASLELPRVNCDRTHLPICPASGRAAFRSPTPRSWSPWAACRAATAPARPAWRRRPRRTAARPGGSSPRCSWRRRSVCVETSILGNVL